MDSTTAVLGAIFVRTPSPRVRDHWAHPNPVTAQRGASAGSERTFVPRRSGHAPCNEKLPFEKWPARKRKFPSWLPVSSAPERLPLYTRASLPDEDVYKVCAAIQARESEISWEESYTVIGQLGQESQATPIDVLLHTGVTQWYREQGFKV